MDELFGEGAGGEVDIDLQAILGPTVGGEWQPEETTGAEGTSDLELAEEGVKHFSLLHCCCHYLGSSEEKNNNKKYLHSLYFTIFGFVYIHK